jgi:signal transduction histidine kinase
MAERPSVARRGVGLLVRFYTLALVQVVLTGVALVVLGRAVLGPPERLLTVGRYAAETVAARLPDVAEARREASRLESALGLRLVLFDPQGRRILGDGAPSLDALLAGAEPSTEPRWLDTDEGFVVLTSEPGATAVVSFSRHGFSSRFLVLALSVVAAAAFLPVFWAYARLVRPLRSLSQAARSFGRGDLEARARIDRGDELGELARSFDAMAAALAVQLRGQQELLANVSHELRTPMARIRVALDLAVEGDAETAREALGEIGEDLDELEQLVDDVLHVARLALAEGRTEEIVPMLRAAPTSLDGVVQRAAQRFRGVHRHEVEIDVDPALPPIECDGALLRRALDNLLDNAGKHTPVDRPIRVSARAASGAVELVVADRGEGIDAEDLPLLGTPFFRADRSRGRGTGGWGLGLALVGRIAAAHGGAFRVESERGVGTTVTLALPLEPRELGA